VTLRAGLDAVEKKKIFIFPFSELKPDCPARSLVTILTALNN